MIKPLHVDWDRLQDRVSERIAERKVPGVSLGLIQGEELRTGSLGKLQLGDSKLVSNDSIFELGSITKLYTSTLVMRVLEMGQAALDVPIKHYVPEFRVMDEEASNKATLWHLLTHTAGWAGDFFVDT